MKLLLQLVFLCITTPRAIAQRRIYIVADTAHFLPNQLKLVNPRDTAFVTISTGTYDMGAVNGYFSLRLDAPDGQYEIYVDRTLRLSAFLRAKAPDCTWAYYAPDGRLMSYDSYRRDVIEEREYDENGNWERRYWRYSNGTTFLIHYRSGHKNVPASYHWGEGGDSKFTRVSVEIGADGGLTSHVVEAGAWNPLRRSKMPTENGRLQGHSYWTFAHHGWGVDFKNGRVTGWEYVDMRSGEELVSWRETATRITPPDR